MDFVVVGLGLGALAILGGVVLLGIVAGHWDRQAARAAAPDSAAYGQAIAGERRAFGLSLIWAGGAMFLATIGALAGSLDDNTGALLVATTATVAALGILVREYFYRVRHPRPRRPRPQSAAPTQSGVALAAATSGARQAPIADCEDEGLAVEPVPEDAPEPVRVADDGDPIAATFKTRVEEPAGEAFEPQTYSFMRDDASEAEVRTVPYSFMLDSAVSGERDSAEDSMAGADGTDAARTPVETGPEDESAPGEAPREQGDPDDEKRQHDLKQGRL